MLASLGALVFPDTPRGRVRSIAILLAGAAALFFVNTRKKPATMFYAARGENILSMRTSAEQAAEYLGRRVPYAGPLTPADTIKLAVALLRRTTPDYAWHVAPVNPLDPVYAGESRRRRARGLRPEIGGTAEFPVLRLERRADQ